MIKSLTFHPEQLQATRLPPGKVPPGTSHRLRQAIRMGWRHDSFWLSEQYYKGKHAYASLAEIHCDALTRIPTKCIRRDLIWPYVLKGKVEIISSTQAGAVRNEPFIIEQGQYAPVFMSVGDYVFTFPAGRHRLLFLAAQFKWMVRYKDAGFAPFKHLLQSDRSGLLAGDPQRIRTRHLRCLAHLWQLAHASSFRQDITIYNQLTDLFDEYLADITEPSITGDSERWKALRETVTEITAYLKKEVVIGNIPTLSDLAELFALSETTLNDYFKKIVGEPSGKYIDRLRMKEAKRLLITTDMKIINIAYQLGYNRIDSFDRAFKRFYGMSPRNMRHKR